jgi:hypothetical protein
MGAQFDDDAGELLAEGSRARVRESRHLTQPSVSKSVAGDGFAPQADRIRALIAQGYIVKRGPCGLTIFNFGLRA